MPSNCFLRRGVIRRLTRHRVQHLRVSITDHRHKREVKQIRTLRVGINKYAAPCRLRAQTVGHDGPELLEYGLARMHPDTVGLAGRAGNGQEFVKAGGVVVQRGQDAVDCAATSGLERKERPGIAVDFDVHERGSVLDVLPDVAGQESAVGRGVERGADAGEFPLHVAAIPEERFLTLGQRLDLLSGQDAAQFGGDCCGVILFDGGLHVLLDRYPLEQPSDHVKDFVGLELLADSLQFLQERLHHLALARLGGDEVHDDHGVVLLAVAMDTTHALLKPRGIPGHVVVDHHPAELQIDALGRRVGADHEPRPALGDGLAELLDLLLTLAVVHPAVDLSDLAGVPHAVEASDKERERVTVLGEDNQFSCATVSG